MLLSYRNRLALIVCLVVVLVPVGPSAIAQGDDQHLSIGSDGPSEAPVLPVTAPPGDGTRAGAEPTWQLPFEAGESWQAGGPHAVNALDFGPFGGTNRRVVAMAAGIAIEVECSSGGRYIGVDHGNGWHTLYYHLTNVDWSLVGTPVSAGTYLGDAAQTLPCGGRSTFNHVHVTFWRDGVKAPVHGKTIGGYTVFDGAADYWGHWHDAAGNTVITNTGNAQCCLLSTTTATAPTPVPTPTVALCNGLPVTIDMNTNGGNGIGTSLADVILGTPGPDTIEGREGADTICGGGGADTIRGGPGGDTILGQAGADHIRGGGGPDTLFGGQADDRIWGQGGADLVYGGAGDDIVNGGGAADTLNGQSGDDILSGQAGADWIDGGQDRDTLRGNAGPDYLLGRNGDDQLFGGEGADNLYGHSGFDRCSGNSGPDAAEANSCEKTPGVAVFF